MNVSTPAIRTRYGELESFFQPRKAAYWIFTLIVGYGVFRFIADMLGGGQRHPTGVLLAVTIYALYAVPFAYLIYKLDLFEREPFGALAAAFAWGAFGATALAMSANNAFLSLLAKTESPFFAGRWGAAIVGPTDEETLKYLGLLLIALIIPRAINSTLDGFIYGACVGLGFQVVEDAYYAIQGIPTLGGSSGSEVFPVLFSFIMRGILSGIWSHALYTGLTGMGLGWALSHPEKPRIVRLAVAALAFAAGWSFHFLWNSPLFAILFVLKGVPFLLVVALLYIFSRRREAGWVRGALESEGANGAATDAEIDDLLTIRHRHAARKRAKHLGGKQAQTLVAELQRAQVGLAVARLRSGDPMDPECVRCRQSIASIRQALAALRPRRGQAAPAGH